MATDIRKQYNEVLEKITAEIDISPAKYKTAVERYTAVGNWLNCGEYEGCDEEPRIYPQGSFRLGTVVRPIRNGKESDYDIDLVCELQKEKEISAPGDIKRDIGDRLQENKVYERMLDKEGRRCWTLNYAEEDGIGFHLDVLPSIPEDREMVRHLQQAGVNQLLSAQAISITHRNGNGSYNWSAGNPGGFADWFDLRKRPVFNKVAASQKSYIFENRQDIFESVDAVPDQLVSTPLQKAIQILKRHRDVRFAGKPQEANKPISMIITTLSAQFYENEEDILSALNNIVEKIYAHAGLMEPGYHLESVLAARRIISLTTEGKWYMPNPVNPYENLADRWHENNHERAKAFFQWVAWARRDFLEILAKNDIQKITESLAGSLGERAVASASSKLSLSTPALFAPAYKKGSTVEITNPSKPWTCHG